LQTNTTLVTSDETKMQKLRHARIRRVKQLLKWMPRKGNLERYPVIKWFSKAARKRPYLWSFKVSSCTPAFYFGSVVAFVPLMGVQLILAFVAAIFLRANLPIIVGLQAISNPLTIAFLWPLNFFIGRKIMDFFGIGTELNPIMSGMNATFLGGIVLGLAAGACFDLFYRLMVHEASKLNLVRRPKRGNRPRLSAAASPPSPPPPPATDPGESTPSAKVSE